jgi:sugar lactone lactonase YvrE
MIGSGALNLSRRIRVLVAGASLAFLPAFCKAQAYLIGTVAGGGLPPTPSPAVSASLNPNGNPALDATGNLYFTANNCVFKVDSMGELTRVAGASTLRGYSGDEGLATNAQLNGPSGVAVDAAGNLYIADSGNNRIRKVASGTGIITTFAGTGAAGYFGDGGLASNARFYGVYGMALDSAGNLYIADYFNSAIRKVSAETGIITTVAGTGNAGYSGDGGPATRAQLNYPADVAVDGSGNLYIADFQNARVRKVTAATGTITTVVGNGVTAYTGDHGPAADAELVAPLGVAADEAGNLFIADEANYRVREVAAATGIITTVAGNGFPADSGDGGQATSAELFANGVAVDRSGDIYVLGDRIRFVAAATGVITTVAGKGGPTYSGDGGPATSAQLALGTFLGVGAGLAEDGSGNLYIADYSNNRVRKVDAETGIITTVAGNGNPGSLGDGGLATNAELLGPSGVAVDSSGNLYIADSSNNRIRKVTATTGIISTVAGTDNAGYFGDGELATSAELDYPQDVAVDGSGNLYIADYQNARIRKVTAATGIISTVAGTGSTGYFGDGGLATKAELILPTGIALDGSANLFIADEATNTIREVAAATGIITTVAGNGTYGYSGDGGPAASALLANPSDVAVDGAGNLYIAEGDFRIRKIAAATGFITTLFGNGAGTFINPIRVGLGHSGQVFFADTENDVVTLINDSGAPRSEVTSSNAASSDHTTFNLLIENSSGAAQEAGLKAALSSGNGVTVGATVTLTETLARDVSAPAANNVVEPEPAQAALARLPQVLGAPVGVPAVRAGPDQAALRRDYQVIRVGIKRLGDQELTDLGAVGVGRVDEVDAEFDDPPERGDGPVPVGRVTPDTRPGDPHGAEAHAVDGQVTADVQRPGRRGGWLRVHLLPPPCRHRHPLMASPARDALPPRMRRDSKPACRPD